MKFVRSTSTKEVSGGFSRQSTVPLPHLTNLEGSASL
jgi:hypothetical protein